MIEYLVTEDRLVTDKPAELYKECLEKHTDRQKYRDNIEGKLKALIKEKQNQIKKLCTEISELGDHIKILEAEKE